MSRELANQLGDGQFVILTDVIQQPQGMVLDIIQADIIIEILHIYINTDNREITSCTPVIQGHFHGILRCPPKTVYCTPILLYGCSF